jgi:transmembrane sensor
MLSRGSDASMRNSTLHVEAAEWFESVHRPDVDTATLESWQRWMAGSRRRQEAFRALEDLWRAAGEVSAQLRWPTAQELADDREDPGAPVEAPSAAQAGAATGTREPPPATPTDRERSPRAWPLAAGVAALAMGGAGWFGWNVLLNPDHAVVRTEAKEHRELTLPDGSRVSVGARTQVTYDYTPTARRIAIDSGEAFFEVEHDAARPFIVRAGAGTVTAVGTAFNVKHVEGRVAVTVVSGVVDVRSAVGAASLPAEREGESGADDGAREAIRAEAPRMLARVKAGEAVVYGPQSLAEVRVAAARAALAWQHGRLEYLDDALKYVVPDVSRYTQKRIVIADPKVAELRFTGTVFEGGVEAWLASLPDIFPVEVVWAGDDTVLVRARASGAVAENP